MTANEAIEEIRRQSADGRARGFMVVSVGEDDIEMYADCVLEKFRGLGREARERFLSRLANGMGETFEESFFHGFRDLFDDAVYDFSHEEEFGYPESAGDAEATLARMIEWAGNDKAKED